MKKIVAIAIPVVLFLAMVMGMGGKGFLLLALLLLVFGGWCVSSAIDTAPKKRLVAWAGYVLLIGWVVFLFS